MVDGKLPGAVSHLITASRRNVEDRTNLAEFFAIGMNVRYPSLDPHTIKDALELPKILCQDGYLEAMQTVHVKIRKSLSDFVASTIIPVDDFSDTVKELSRAMQSNLTLISELKATSQGKERVTPHELKKLLEFLVPLSQHDLKQMLKCGLKNVLNLKTQMGQ